MGVTTSVEAEALHARKAEDAKKRERILDEDITTLKNYQVGTFTGTAQYTANNLVLPDNLVVKIGLFGPTGAGKSSFINTCERTLLKIGAGTCNIQSSGDEGPIRIHECLHELKFRLLDTRGFSHFNNIQPFKDVIEGRMGDSAVMPDDDAPIPIEGQPIILQGQSNKISISSQISVVVFVINGQDPRLNSPSLFSNLTAHRKYMRDEGITCITIVTKFDLLTPEERKSVLANASRATGSPVNQTFYVTNYIQDGCPRNITIEEQIVKILKYALSAAELTIRVKLLQERKDRQSTETLRITVVSKVPNHTGTCAFIVPRSDTVGTLMQIVKPHFELQNAEGVFFATEKDEVLAESTPLTSEHIGNAVFLQVRNTN